MENNKIRILICSDLNYEEVIAEIYIEDKYIALLNQDKGLNNLIIEFPGKGMVESAISRVINLNDFEKAVELAKKALKNRIES